jgi:hypothetical protein
MHGLNKSLDIEFLSDKSIIALQFGSSQWAVQIHIDFDISITVESMVQINENNRFLVIEDFHEKSNELCKIIGLEIKYAQISENGGLVLKLKNNVDVIIYNSNENYESFQLRVKDEIYVA